MQPALEPSLQTGSADSNDDLERPSAALLVFPQDQPLEAKVA